MTRVPSTPILSHEDAPPARMSIHPFQSLKRHRKIALIIAGVLAAIGIPMLIKLQRPVYMAEAIFMVTPVSRNPGEDRETSLPRYAEFVNQQVVLVVREDVCVEALDRMGESRSAWQLPGESLKDAAFRLSTSLQATVIPDTSYVSVSLRSSQEKGLTEVLNSVMRSYLDQARGQTRYGLIERTEALNRRVSELLEEIRGKSEQLGRWAKELGVPSMEPTVLRPLIEEMERTPREAQARRVAADARLAGIEARYKVLKETNAADRTVLVPDAELMQLRAVLLTRKSELKAKLFGLTPQHEGRKAVEAEIGDIEAELKREEKAALDRQIRLADSKLEEARGNELVVAQAEVADARRYEQVVTQEMASLREKIQRLYPDSQSVLQEVARLQAQLGTAQERLNSVRLETHAPGFVQLVQGAGLSEVPAARRLSKGLGVLAGAMAFLVLAVPVLLDAIRNRVRNDSDLEGAVIAVPSWTGDRDADPAVSDQLRRLALALDRERRLNNRSAFVFTSVLPGSGTTELVLDVTRELGKIGVTALAVEANAFKPDPRYCSNGHPGLAVGMPKGIAADEMVNTSDETLPDRIAVGATGGRTTLSGLDKFDSLLGDILKRYQVVLIDSPPILQSADAEFLATHGRAVVLVVEADRTPRAALEQANRILRQDGATVILTVMNRARSWKDQGQHHGSVADKESR